MKKNLLLVICVIAVVGCASVRTIKGPDANAIMTAKRVYVIRHPKSSKDIDLYIQEALAERGMRVNSGPEEQMPSDVDMYIRYIDKLYWDMGIYMITLNISAYDKKTNALIKSADFKNSPFHTGKARNWTKKVVNKLFTD